MARRHRRRGRHGFKIPVLSTAILIGQGLVAHAMDSSPLGTLNHFQQFYSGFDLQSGSFTPNALLVGYGPWLVKGLVGKVARPLGAAPRMPIRGLPISFS